MDTVELTLVTPTSLSELDEVFDDFLFLSHFSPENPSESQLREVLEGALGWSTLFYFNNILCGCWALDVYKRSVEIHGVFRPDLPKVFPYRYRAIKRHISTKLLDLVFYKLRKPIVTMKAFPDNKGVRGFAIQFGFKRLKNKDKGRIVWKLERREYGIRKKESYGR